MRTVPEHRYDGLPRGEFTILESYLRALRGAERLVYLESQFLWSPELIAVLADKLRDPPHPDFRVVVVLLPRSRTTARTTRAASSVCSWTLRRRVARTSAFSRARSFRPAGHAGQVYVHAKGRASSTTRWMTCRLGESDHEHSLFNDTEVNV